MLSFCYQKSAPSSVFLSQAVGMERDVAASLLQSQALKNALSLLLPRVCEDFDWHGARAWLPSFDDRVLQSGEIWPQDFPTTTREVKPGQGFVGCAWIRDEAQWQHNFNLDNANFDNSADANVITDDIEYSMPTGLAIPIVFNGRVAVVLEFRSRDERNCENRNRDERNRESDEAAAMTQAVAGLLTTIEHEYSYQALCRSEEWLRAAADGSIVSFTILHLVRDRENVPCDLKFVFANERAAQFLQLPQQEFIGHNFLALFPNETAHAFFAQCLQVATTREPIEYELLVPRILENAASPNTSAQDELWVHYQIVAVREGVAVTAQDISERKTAEAALRASEDRFRTLIENSTDIISIMDGDGFILYESPSIERILGWNPQDLIGRNAFEFVHPEDAERTATQLARLSTQPGTTEMVCFRFLCPDGSWRHLEAVGNNMIEQPEVGGILINSRDISERVLQEQKIEAQARELERANDQLQDLATRDDMTKLKNQRAFREEIERQWAHAQRQGWPLSLAILDVDCFKQFNDSFGHQAGDRVLVRIAELLHEHSRESDFVARYGGEEFVLLMINTPEEGATEHAERLRAAIENAHWPQRNVTASFGVATWQLGREPHNPTDSDTIFAHADRALYHSKNTGRNRISHHYQVPTTPENPAPCEA